MKGKNYWKEILMSDQKEIERVDRAVKKKDRKFLDNWFDRYNREGIFWDKKSKGKDYL